MAHHAPLSQTTTILMDTGDTAYIGRDVQVSVTGSHAISMGTETNCQAVVDGTLSARWAVLLANQSNLIINRTGVVSGGEAGIAVDGAGHYTLNYGLIYGNLYGIWEGAGASPGRIDNYGTIQSGFHNSADAATIRFMFSGTKTIFNAGTIEAMKAGTPAILSTDPTSVEMITNTGTIKGAISLGGGSDTLNSLSGRSIGTIDAGAGDDTVTGGTGNDIIIGGVGVDTLNGGLGRDTLTGGADADRFIFSAKTHSAVGVSADRIIDFDDGNAGDRIDLSALFGPAMAYRHALAFTAAGQVRINDVAGADLLVEVNTGGSLGADFSVRLVGTTLASMTASDFVL